METHKQTRMSRKHIHTKALTCCRCSSEGLEQKEASKCPLVLHVRPAAEAELRRFAFQSE